MPTDEPDNYMYRPTLELVDEIQDYAIFYLDQHGFVRSWNKGAAQIKGYSSEEIIGKSISVFYQEKDRKEGLPARLLGQAASTGRAYHEGWRVRKNQTLFWGSVTITAMHEQGKLSGFLKITRDLTDRMVAEAKIKEQIEELRIKNSELEQFVYIASHDLQEPLITISSLMNLLKEEYLHASHDTIDFYIDAARESADRMRQLIKGILDYARIGTKRVAESINCMELIGQIESDMMTLIKESDAQLKYNNLPVIVGFMPEMRQLFQNLISNAIKFRNPVTSPIIKIDCKQESDGWKFLIEDNGIGIASMHQEKIFMIFQRLHTRQIYEGTGLGLANCKKIVEIHGGKISVQSQPGTGSTFFFTIPYRNHH